MDWEQLQVFGNDRVTLEVRFSDYEGWEWILRHFDTHAGWQVLDSGLAPGPAVALQLAASALKDLALSWTADAS